MTFSGRAAFADQLHAEVRDARDCDPLEPCKSCRAKTQTVRSARRVARVAVAMGAEPAHIPAPRQPSMLSQRLAQIAL